MDKRENLPAKLTAQGLAVAAEKRGSLVARGMVAVLANNQHALIKSNDALYRHAREVYNRLTDDGLGSWFGYKERELPLTEAFNSFQQLAAEGYGKAYYPLSTLYGGDQSIQGDTAQAERFHKLAFDWLFANQLQNDPEIWNDLGKLYLYLASDSNYYGNKDIAFLWFLKAANMGDANAMWHVSGMYEDCRFSGWQSDYEDGGGSLHWQIKAAKAGHEKAQRGLEQQHEHGDLETKIGDEEVFDCYVWSAEQGRLWAQLFLAEAYRCGDLIEQNDEQAAHWYLQAATQGEPHAQMQLGKMYWEGRGVEQDYDQAEYWLENSADQGSAESQYQFGQFLCEKGGEEEKAGQLIQCAADQEYGPAQYVIASDIGFFDVPDEQCAELFDKALTWYEVEAKFDSELRLDLALMHLDSWQAPYNKSHRANRFDGLRLLEEVASEPLAIGFDTGEPSSKNDAQRRASRRLGNEILKHPNTAEVVKAIHWLEQAADLGDAVASVDLAELYLHGHLRGNHSREPHSKLVEIDLQAAVHWFERGFQLGWSTAAYKLGYEYLVGKHLPQNVQLSEKWLLQAAHAGHGSAQLVLGQEYASGVRFRQDADSAIYWLKLSAERSKSTGLKLAEIYLDGKIVPRSFDEAIKWLSLAAESGNAPAQFRLAWIFAEVKYDYGRALQWYLAAAKQGSMHAQESLGLLYEFGLDEHHGGIKKDTDKSLYWYRKATEQGRTQEQVQVQFELGSMFAKMSIYRSGTAQTWYHRAAEKGHVEAQCLLGEEFEFGDGWRDYKAAAFWYQKAAEQGNARAQNNLGLMYANGVGMAIGGKLAGVEKNIELAIYWFRKAAEQGNQYAIKNLEELGVM